MKPFQNITVFVEYRYDGPGDGTNDNIPCGRRVRARVAETVTTSGAVCRAWGTDLLGGRNLTDRDMMTVHSVCLRQLRGTAKRVTFTYDLPLGLEAEWYPIPEVA